MDTMDDVERGKQLRDLRKAAGLTQKEAGAHFGIDKSAVSEWERGLGRPTPDKIASLDQLYRADGAVIELLIHDETTGPTALENLRDVVEELAEIQRGLSVQVEALVSEVAHLSRRFGPGSVDSPRGSP